MSTTRIINARIVNQGDIFEGEIEIQNGKISGVTAKGATPNNNADHIINAHGNYVFPGAIDDQVHFREPGLTHKADIYHEAKAAIAGGVTSFMEMPNTIPNVFTQELLEDKYKIASEKSLANYSFYLGASNNNLEEILKTDQTQVCGIKIFMGSSTGNMLVDHVESLESIFANCKMLIATHCEDEATLVANSAKFKSQYGEDVPMKCHPAIRSVEACYKSSSLAVKLARKYNTRLHVLHISTEKELSLFDSELSLKEKRITAEACIHHLWFDDSSYEDKGTLIKWNPAIKTSQDRTAILEAVKKGQIDVIATDHAPHTLNEKQNRYFEAPSGGPLIQHSIVTMLELYHRGQISLEEICTRMCHAPADCFQVANRGYITEGYWADLVIADLNSPWVVEKENIVSKCGWSPFEGQTFQSKITHTFVNGHLAYENNSGNEALGKFYEQNKGMRLKFDR